MIRLLKLASYALLGYALYEFYIGLTTETPVVRNRDNRASLPENAQRQTRQVRSTSGGGSRAQTQTPDGGSASHAVGRGVVQ